MEPAVRQTIRVVAPLVWAAAILWLSLMPAPPSPPTWLSWDKLQHAGAYALLTLLLGRAIVPAVRSRRRGWRGAALVAFLYGGLVELAQGLCTASRTAEVGDLLANGAGVLAVLAVIALARRCRGASVLEERP